MKIGQQVPDDKALVYYEDKVLIALNYTLLVPKQLVQPHVDSILFMCDKTLEDCIGKEAYKFYTASLEKQQSNHEQKMNNQTLHELRDYADIKRTKSNNEALLKKRYLS